MNDTVETVPEVAFSMSVFLKSKTVIVSDTKELPIKDVEVLYAQIKAALRESNTSGVLNTTRNEKAVLIPVGSVDYVEFSMITLSDEGTVNESTS